MKLLGLLSFLAAFATSASAEVSYTVTELPVPRFAVTQPTGINSSGQISGYAHDIFLFAQRRFIFGPFPSTGFFYNNGAVSTLTGLGGVAVNAYGLNDAGQIVGSSSIANEKATRAVLFANGSTTDLGSLGGTSSQANAISAAGQIVGSSTLRGDKATHAFSMAPGGPMVDLGSLGGTASTAAAVNASGQVVGDSSLKGDKRTHAFLRLPGAAMVDLGSLGGTYSTASAINSSGLIVGSSSLAGDRKTHAFLFAGGTMIDLGPSGNSYSQASGINATGQIVGSLSTPKGTIHAFLFSGGSFLDLNGLISPTSGWTLENATAINDSGLIVGSGTLNGKSRAFVLRQISQGVPPPVLALSGRTKLATSKPKIRLSGSASGNVISVTFRVGRKGEYRACAGGAAWQLDARLKPGKNLITIIAHGSGGDSAPARVTATLR